MLIPFVARGEERHDMPNTWKQMYAKTRTMRYVLAIDKVQEQTKQFLSRSSCI